MHRRKQPDTWECPHWHPDYGDVRSEFESLRGVARAILELSSNLDVDLDIPEPGLMYLAVHRGGRCIAEVYVVDPIGSDQRQFGVFQFLSDDETETYCDSPLDAARLVATPA